MHNATLTGAATALCPLPPRYLSDTREAWHQWDSPPHPLLNCSWIICTPRLKSSGAHRLVDNIRSHLVRSALAALTCSHAVCSIHDLGVYIDADMSMRTHVTAVVRACFAALRQIRSVRWSMSRHALLTLACALIVSKMNYCNSVLAGISG